MVKIGNEKTRNKNRKIETHHDKHSELVHALQCEPCFLHEKQTVLPQHTMGKKLLLPRKQMKNRRNHTKGERQREKERESSF